MTSNKCVAQECPSPCTRMNIVGKLMRKGPKDVHKVKIVFRPDVLVTKSILTRTSLDLVSSIGGVIGLTLGQPVGNTQVL